MQMYKVKGADGGVYGPVLGVVIHQWIAEGRLNGESLVSPDGTEVWRPVRDYPEFIPSLTAAVTAGAGGHGPAGSIGRDSAITAARTPGLMLVIFGALMALFTVVGLIMSAVQGQAAMPALPPEAPEWLRNLFQMQANLPKWVSYVQFVVAAAIDAVIILGGLGLMRLRNRGLAIAGAILAGLPCFTSCCCVLGLPLGIWVVIFCNRPDIRPHFDS